MKAFLKERQKSHGELSMASRLLLFLQLNINISSSQYLQLDHRLKLILYSENDFAEDPTNKFHFYLPAEIVAWYKYVIYWTVFSWNKSIIDACIPSTHYLSQNLSPAYSLVHFCKSEFSNAINISIRYSWLPKCYFDLIAFNELGRI